MLRRHAVLASNVYRCFSEIQLHRPLKTIINCWKLAENWHSRDGCIYVTELVYRCFRMFSSPTSWTQRCFLFDVTCSCRSTSTCLKAGFRLDVKSVGTCHIAWETYAWGNWLPVALWQSSGQPTHPPHSVTRAFWSPLGSLRTLNALQRGMQTDFIHESGTCFEACHL